MSVGGISQVLLFDLLPYDSILPSTDELPIAIADTENSPSYTTSCSTAKKFWPKDAKRPPFSLALQLQGSQSPIDWRVEGFRGKMCASRGRDFAAESVAGLWLDGSRGRS